MDICTSIFIETLLRIAKKMEITQMSIDDQWLNKRQCIHTVGYYPALKRNYILTHATTLMNSEDTRLSKTCDTKGKILYDSTYEVPRVVDSTGTEVEQRLPGAGRRWGVGVVKWVWGFSLGS